ncbi:MAG TPA: DUF3108 domain-containing protein [Vitreimonas sp.]|uniref:DUF3108 domain-containing protein n=1 Tax=Vitreimonas sp. TaxID=3069702 RepID=UPI002D34747E|nr:DUF3108 domain-containing protein [Vitreimonas sp.]HYD88680.1 DUF3108 domain-containing protein [Vitreimonas sp.]
MIKKIAAAALALGLALAGPAAAQSGNRSFDGVYSVHARGVEAGDFTYSFRQNGSTYTATAEREMKGWVGAALRRSQDYTYSVRGNVTADGTLRPTQYQHQGGRRRDDRPNGRLVRATFSANDVATTSVPAGMGMGDPPATAAQRRGVIDQITAIAAMVTATGDPCSRTLPIYMDGRSRFDFVLTPNGTVNINSRAYQGPGVRCRVQFRPIAGFGDPQEPATLTFLFARTESGMWAPVTIEMPTDGVGVVRLEARRLTVNGQRLR